MANVWSVNYKYGHAVVVDQGPRNYCAESAERRNAAAEHLGTRMKFLVLPAGEMPSEEDLTDPNLYLGAGEDKVVRQLADAGNAASTDRRPDPSPYL